MSFFDDIGSGFTQDFNFGKNLFSGFGDALGGLEKLLAWLPYILVGGLGLFAVAEASQFL